jgi:hypothetical protein
LTFEQIVAVTPVKPVGIRSFAALEFVIAIAALERIDSELADLPPSRCTSGNERITRI